MPVYQKPKVAATPVPGAAPMMAAAAPAPQQPTVRVRFKKTRTVKDGTGLTYQEGKDYDLPADSAGHWVGRGIAVMLDDKGEEVPGMQPAPLAHAVEARPAEAAKGPAPTPAPVHQPDRGPTSKPDALKGSDVKKA